jgi:hypothetical protein
LSDSTVCSIASNKDIGVVDRVVGTADDNLASVLPDLEDSLAKLDLFLWDLRCQQSTQIPPSNDPIVTAIPFDL